MDNKQGCISLATIFFDSSKAYSATSSKLTFQVQTVEAVAAPCAKRTVTEKSLMPLNTALLINFFMLFNFDALIFRLAQILHLGANFAPWYWEQKLKVFEK